MKEKLLEEINLLCTKESKNALFIEKLSAGETRRENSKTSFSKYRYVGE